MKRKNPIDILLIPAPIHFRKRGQAAFYGDETSIPPLGLMYIASYLRSRGYNCQILEVGLKNLTLVETIKRIKRIKPKVVGISILSASTITAVPLAKEIKKELPHVIVGCGGTHVCVDPTFIERYPYFDFAVKGEGELMMYEIMKKMDDGKKVSGMYDGGYVKDLNSLPFPDYNLISFPEYGYPLDKVGKRWTAISIMSSRGCPFNCSFCCKSDSRRYVRYRSADNIFAEIETHYPISRGEYSFVDDILTLNPKVVTDLCKKIIAKKLKFSWIAMTRADCLDIGLAKIMKKAGCRELLIGVESGDPRVRNEIVKKRVNDEDIFRAIKICRQVGIRSSIFLMLGFPTEGKEEVEETLNYAFRAKPDLIGIHLTMPSPGSELWVQAIKEKIISSDLVDQFIAGKLGEDYSSWPIYVPKGLSREYLEKARGRGLRQFYLSPQFLGQITRYYLYFPSRIKYDKHLIKSGIPMLLKGRSKVQFS